MDKKCQKCGSPVFGDRRRKYCSRQCQPSRPKTREIKECEGCGVEFEVFAYHSETRRFCNMECYHRTRWGGVKSFTQKCEHCGDSFKCFDSEPRRFCSHPCYVESGSGAKSGSSSPLWKGGTSKHYRRGLDWKAQAALARDRDLHECKECGRKENSLAGVRRKLDVHHIIPYSVSQCNELSNLVTLCRSCHHRNEPKPEIVQWLAADIRNQESFLEQARTAWGLQ